MPSAVRNDVRASAGRAASLAWPAWTAARNSSASTRQRPPSARTYPPGPVWISVRSPSARRMRLTRTSMFPAGSAGGSSGHSASAIRSFGTRVPRRSAISRSSRRASLPPNARRAISWPSRSTANRPSSLILITPGPSGGGVPEARSMDEPRGAETLAGGELAADGCLAGDDRHGGFTGPAGRAGNVLRLLSPRNALPPRPCRGAPGLCLVPVSLMLPPDAARSTGLRSVRGHGGWLS